MSGRPARSAPLLVGLTGNIGSGKSTVAQMLARRGAGLIDSDLLAREATADPGVLAAIAEELGPGVVVRDEEGTPHLDRQATAARVFADEGALAKLNAVVHPWVRRRTAERLQEISSSLTPPTVVVLDIPLLFENDLREGLDAVVVVSAPLDVRVARVGRRSGLTEEETKRRDAAQLPLEQKVARADFVVDNAGDESDLEERVERLWRELLAHAAVQEGATS